MKVQVGSKVYYDALARLSQDQLSDAINNLSRTQLRRPKNAKPYKAPAPIALEIMQFGGSRARFIVRPVDLTPRGVGVLTATFLHPNSSCEIHLSTQDGQYLTVGARVADCQHASGRLHFVSIEFDSPIETEHFHDTVDQDLGDLDQEDGRLSLFSNFEAAISKFAPKDQAALFASMMPLSRGEPSILRRNELASRDRIAVLSTSLEIQLVNPAWLLFALENGYSGQPFAGSDYALPLKSAVDACPDVLPILNGLLGIQNGDSQEFRYLYSCSHPRAQSQSWFIVRHAKAKRQGQDCILVTHRQVDMTQDQEASQTPMPEDPCESPAPGESEPSSDPDAS